jgi:hypothetical protein
MNLMCSRKRLYRRHLALPYCARCKDVIDTDASLQTHLVDPLSCSFKPGDPPKGISVEIQKALKRRRTTGQNLPQWERWKEIYRMLFDNHDVPEPCIYPTSTMNLTPSAPLMIHT